MKNEEPVSYICETHHSKLRCRAVKREQGFKHMYKNGKVQFFLPWSSLTTSLPPLLRWTDCNTGTREAKFLPL